MGAWLRRNRAFVLASASALGLALGIVVLWSRLGHELLAAVHAGEAWGPLNGLLDERARKLPLAHHLERWDEDMAALVACLVGLWALAAAVYVPLRTRARWWGVPVALLLWWVGVELLVAPRLVRRLRLVEYSIVRDPDHRPVAPSPPPPGWNSDAIRGAPESSEIRAEEFVVLFLGDSFTYGQGIRDPAQVFPARVEALLRERFPDLDVRSINFGWTSSSPVLSWRRLIDQGDRYRPDLVALCLDMTDVHDDVKWSSMLGRRGIYRYYDVFPLTLELLRRLAPGLYWSWWQRSNGGLPRERYFLTERPLEETRPHFATLVDSVGRIAAWCDERDLPFVLFVLPRYHQYSDVECPDDYELEMPGRAHSILGPHVLEPFRFFTELGRRADYPVRSLLEEFRASTVHPHCFPDDPHWNEAGHAIAAEAVARDLAELIEARAPER